MFTKLILLSGIILIGNAMADGSEGAPPSPPSSLSEGAVSRLSATSGVGSPASPISHTMAPLMDAPEPSGLPRVDTGTQTGSDSSTTGSTTLSDVEISNINEDARSALFSVYNDEKSSDSFEWQQDLLKAIGARPADALIQLYEEQRSQGEDLKDEREFYCLVEALRTEETNVLAVYAALIETDRGSLPEVIAYAATAAAA